MAVALVEPSLAHPHVRAVRDGRPPGSTWSSSPRPPSTQPPLSFDPLPGADPAQSSGPWDRPHPVGHRVLAVASPGSAVPSPSMPDPRAWAPSLALALAETLSGRRPVGQLSRWVDERVQSTLSRALHARRPAPAVSSSGSAVSRPEAATWRRVPAPPTGRTPQPPPPARTRRPLPRVRSSCARSGCSSRTPRPSRSPHTSSPAAVRRRSRSGSSRGATGGSAPPSTWVRTGADQARRTLFQLSLEG
jgi:hypothetical protein